MTSDAPPRADHPAGHAANGPVEPLLPAALRPLGAFEPLYRRAVARRNAGFDRGERVRRVPIPVISVGNLSVGGVGKTPVVTRLARELLARGLRPVIAMRGYGKRGGEPSDEEREYHEALPGVDVLVNPDRVAAITAHLDAGRPADVALLDDGFQHRFLARDLDLVLLDATRDPFRDRCLPRGRLREPVESLARAHAAIVTRVDQVDPDAAARLIERAHATLGIDGIVAACAHRWRALRRYADGRTDAAPGPVDALRGLRVVIVSGIGNPGAFRAQVERSGATVVFEHALRDHARYAPRVIERLAADAGARGASAIVTTRKDWVKIRDALPPAGLPGMSWLVPEVEIVFTRGERALLDLVFHAAARGEERL